MNRSITKITEEMGPVGNKGHEIFFCPDIKCCEPFNIAIQVQALQEGGKYYWVFNWKWISVRDAPFKLQSDGLQMNSSTIAPKSLAAEKYLSLRAKRVKAISGLHCGLNDCLGLHCAASHCRSMAFESDCFRQQHLAQYDNGIKSGGQNIWTFPISWKILLINHPCLLPFQVEVCYQI